MLLNHHKPQHWWPGDSFFEIITGAVLTQNTNWINVSQAIDRLKQESLLEPRAMWNAPAEVVKQCIMPAGYYNVKYNRLRSFLAYLIGIDLDFHAFFRTDLIPLRSEILGIKGIGPETADSILLYAFHRPIFVVDAYTRRMFSRMGHRWMIGAPYEQIQAFFHQSLPREAAFFNEAHALIVNHSKKVCKKTPRCEQCVLIDQCERWVGSNESKDKADMPKKEKSRHVGISNMR